MSQAQTTINAVAGDGKTLNFNSQGYYTLSAVNINESASGVFDISSNGYINIKTDNGYFNMHAENDYLSLSSNSASNQAILIQATNPTGGILTTTGSGGYSLITSNGDINLLSQGANVNVGVSPLGTPAGEQTQNITLECFNDFNTSAGDMYFVSSDVISFISNTGDIQFGTSANGAPIIKFQDGNVLINQASSTQDYQLDIAITDSSVAHQGYNGIMVNSFQSNVASDITLQTSNTLGDGTQGILSMGVFGSDNTRANFQSYLAYQTSNIVIRLDGPSYSAGKSYIGFGNDFTYNDIGRNIYWPTLDKQDTINGLGVYVSPTSDTANVSVSGTYTGNNSRVYLMQIDSTSSPNTFMWSNNGGVSFNKQFVPIVASTPITLDSGLQITFTSATGFSLNQQFIFQTKITALVSTVEATPTIPTTVYTLQPYYAYIKTTTPSDIVIKTNNTEKMRITGDGAIGIQKKIPTACLDLDSNYNKVLIVNQTTTGYQVNPSISYLTSGGYVLVWNSQDDPSALNFNVIAQRYLADGSRYATNFQVNTITSGNQSYPVVAGSRTINSNHYIITWSSQDTATGLYKVYFQIYHNNEPIYPSDIQVDTSNPATSNQQNPRVAGLYNGNYAITWAADDTGSGVYRIYGAVIQDDATNLGKFTISNASAYSANFPYPAGLPSDDANIPNGFVIGFMTALDSSVDPRYAISVRVMRPNGTPYTAQIPITAIGSNVYSSISDGLLSVAELNLHEVNSQYGNGGFAMAFYRNYQADTSLYQIGDNVQGLQSSATASISALYPANKIITVDNVSNRLLVDEEIQITSSIFGVGNIIEKIESITYLTNNTANITLDNGSKNVVAYRFQSNLTQTSDAIWYTQVNTSQLYADDDRFSGNVNIFQYKRPLASICVDNEGTGLVTWSNGSIPSVYYQVLNISNGELLGLEERLTSSYDGLKQRDQIATSLQSIGGNDYGFIISWDNQSLDLLDTGVYQQLVGYGHSLLSLTDGNSNFIFNHQSQCGIGILAPTDNLHIKAAGTASFFDPANPVGITLQNTAQHIITNQDQQRITFQDGSSNILNIIHSTNALRYDDLAPHPESLIGFYKFDEFQGTQAADSSPYSSYLYNNLPVYINTSAILVNFDFENCWYSGLINNALLFDGNNDYCFIEASAPNNINTSLESNQAFSISCWVNISSNIVSNATYDIVSNGGDLSISGTYILSIQDIAGNGNMKSNITVSITQGATLVPISLIGNVIINDENWHHLVSTISLNGSNCTIFSYVDGVLDNTTSQSGTITGIQHSAFNTYIGSRDSTQNFFRGYLDELRFYNTVLTSSDITTLFTYGNPNATPKGNLILNANNNPSHNLGLILDDTGKLNNLSSKPLPYTILSGELIAYNSNTTIYGIGTQFLNEITVGDILTMNLTTTPEDFTVLSITSNILLTLDQRPNTTIEIEKPYQSVLRRPSIYSFFDNGDNIKGHVDSYGNLMIGATRPSTMLEISGTSNSTVNIPEITITNITPVNTYYGRKTAVNFRSYDATDALNPPVILGHIETAHQGTSTDNQGIMRFFTNDGSQENNVLSLTSNGYVGIGGENQPLGMLHVLSTSTSTDCGLILQSGSNGSATGASSVYDERSAVYFAGVASITETANTDIKKKVLAAITGANDATGKILNGRLDFLTNNDDEPVKNGIESRMSITHTGNIGLCIQSPPNVITMAPERRLTNGTINSITNAVYATGNTTITLTDNIFSGLTTEEKNMFIGGTFLIENTTLTTSSITGVSGNNTLTVGSNVSAYIGYNCYVHYSGLNITSTGFTGINTTTPTAPLSINGAITHSITKTTTNITLNISHYTVLGDTTSGVITITLPANSATIAGRIYNIKRIGANTLNINTNGSNIDGTTPTYSLTTIYDHITIQSDGTNWWII
jgi:hypothetical protein